MLQPSGAYANMARRPSTALKAGKAATAGHQLLSRRSLGRAECQGHPPAFPRFYPWRKIHCKL